MWMLSVTAFVWCKAIFFLAWVLFWMVLEIKVGSTAPSFKTAIWTSTLAPPPVAYGANFIEPVKSTKISFCG